MSTSDASPALTPSAFIGARFSPGKVAFPLTNGVQYATFEHVRGVPPTGENGGYSVNRLHVLNAILERYARVESRSMEQVTQSEEDITVDIIEENAIALQDAVEHSVYGMSYGNGIYETGVGFSAEG